VSTVFEHAAFRRLWLANVLSQTGSQISRIGLILVVVERTGSVAALALLVCLEALPAAIVAPLAGAVVDRRSRRAVMVSADLVRFASVMVILAAPTYGTICAMAAVHSVATGFFQPARAAALPLAVPREHIVAANSWDQGAANLMFIVGPALGTELLLALGLSWTLIVDGATFLLSASLIPSLPGDNMRGREPAPLLASAVDDIRSGWRYLRTHDLALHLSALFFVSLLCAGLWTPLAPFFVRDYLGGTTRLLGWQFSAFGTGAIFGSMIAPPLVRRCGRGPIVCAGLVGEGVCQTAYAMVPNIAVSTALMFGWGAVVSLIVVPFYSILQTVVDERFLGRVFSTVKQSENLAMAAALGLAIVLQPTLDSHTILLAGGLTYCALALASLLTQGGRSLLGTR
jgi:MFS family permease